MSLMYFYSGFYVMFLTIMFMELGVRRKNRALFSGMGRIVRSVVTAAVILTTTLFSDLFTMPVCIVLSCIFSIAIIIVMALLGIFIPERPITNNIEIIKDDKSFEERLSIVFEKYNLTQKERESFERLVTTEMAAQEIADEMGISRRVLSLKIKTLQFIVDVKKLKRRYLYV